MRIGFVGTGKLGLPVSLIYATKGHVIRCYDTNPVFYSGASPYHQIYHEELCPQNKNPLREFLPPIETLNYAHDTLDAVVRDSDIVFLAVQTPHSPLYEGTTRLPESRVDFNYTYLIDAVKAVSVVIDSLKRDVPVIIISTVLPGTIRREILPLLSSHVKLCYNPYFIAMGTVAHDCLSPEFILLGTHDEAAESRVTEFYKTICDARVFKTTIENAEMIKVCYNTFIGTKIAMTNTIMELCHNSPNTDCDTVIDALSLATQRLISPAYLRGGMGDGGGCHPRDNIALSWYSKTKGIGYDWFESIMITREKQCEFLADLVCKESTTCDLPIVLLGIAFKPNTSITTGSPARLIETILRERGVNVVVHDPISKPELQPTDPAIFLISCKHDIFKTYVLPPGSVLIDPHRAYSAILPIGTYVPVGRG